MQHFRNRTKNDTDGSVIKVSVTSSNKPRGPREGRISFPAYFAGLIPTETGKTADGEKVVMSLLPLEIHKLAAVPEAEIQTVLLDGGVRKPLYAPLTASGDAIVLLYKIGKGDTLPNSRKKAVYAEPTTEQERLHTAIVANNQHLICSFFLRDSEIKALPPPGSFVKVVNFGLAIDKNGVTRLNGDGVVAMTADEIGNLSPGDYLTAASPIVAQRLLSIDAFKVLARGLSESINENMDSKKQRAAQREYLRKVGLPALPVMRLDMYKSYPKNAVGIDEILPVRGVVGDAALLNKAIVLEPSAQGEAIYTPANGNNKATFSLTMAFVGDIGNHRKVKLPDVKLWSNHFESLGLAYAPFVQALLSRHSVSFMLLASVNVPETLAMNSSIGKTAVPEVKLDVLGVRFRMLEYLLRRAVPVTEAFVKTRYNIRGEGGVIRATKFAPENYSSLLETFSMTAPTMAQYKQVGFACLDEGEHDLPESDDDRAHTLYFACPLFDMSDEIPMAPRDDPLCKDDAADLPPAVDLTAEAGDALLTRKLPGGTLPKEPRGWLGDGGLPRFLFFMVDDRHATITEEQRRFFFETIESHPLVRAADGKDEDFTHWLETQWYPTNLVDKRPLEHDAQADSAEHPAKRQRFDSDEEAQ